MQPVRQLARVEGFGDHVRGAQPAVGQDLVDLHQNGVRLRVIGERDRLDPELLRLMDEAVDLTRDNAKLNLIVAFNYGSRTEIARAAQRLAERVRAGEIGPDDITPDAISTELFTREIPDPDLLIRTSGELRLSNFLLWQAAYSELVFLDTFWPDFDRTALETAIATYRQRQRRFGGV